ncbi:MAG: DUF5398 family protein [Anaerolineae bacterium]
MFGLENKPKKPFEFDLEEDLRKDPDKARKLLKSVEEKIHEIKALLRQGAQSQDFDKFGILLHGYAALQRVLNRILRK